MAYSGMNRVHIPGFPIPPNPAYMNMIRHEQPLPQIFYYLDDPKNERKWLNQKEDITDYFNYGMNEDTWKIYADKIKKLSSKIEKRNNVVHERNSLDDRTPLEFGGFGTPYFSAIRDLPFLNVIKKNKERFILQYLRDPEKLDKQFSKALSKDMAEESYKIVQN